ncbi:hypothetical protein GWI33_019994 [Rhynchophorus ferrugineus]|uniref:Ubiquitin-like domain-containing protein n=1 Tax=Rhynchophorus ferrugineus TaxID=354439 RepID=A0A834HQA9_RHYFE|nr:hypothetical protein GWI33_019994 [Rhynchophorus ferrugineus]
MDSLPVTLIVKAPNQQVEDQKIRCETSWTINKLKQHLSEVYPSRPPHHEQKLIYSGQLLGDSVVLKDILRQYDGQDTHTVHLVCTSKHSQINNRSKQVSPTVTNNENGGAMNDNPATNNSATSANVSSENSTQNGSANGGDNRVPPTYHHPWMMNGQFPQVDYSNLNHYQMQMVMMQRAYMEYITQYMQIAAGQTPPPTAVPNATVNNQPVQEAPVPPNQPERVLDENEPRDWLDRTYMFGRAVILFSVVYFYSSPARFLFVLAFAVALYLYQIGYFRQQSNVNNNTMDGTPHDAPEDEPAPTRTMVAWTFITTFFASLIPDIPNINT